jgi:hypothetical protein
MSIFADYWADFSDNLRAARGLTLRQIRAVGVVSGIPIMDFASGGFLAYVFLGSILSSLFSHISGELWLLLYLAT